VMGDGDLKALVGFNLSADAMQAAKVLAPMTVGGD
jgi:hypothetical protein